MTKQVINVGTSVNDRTGDSIRSAFQKVNANFTEVYNALGLGNSTLTIGSFEFTGSTITTNDSSSVVLDQAITVTSNLTVDGDIVAQNIPTVTSTVGLNQVYFDPITGKLVVLV